MKALLPHVIIRKPRVTEKSTIAMESNHYIFEVDTRATKDDIKSALESLYKVKVETVNTQIRKGKNRRLKYGLTKEKTIKLANVRLAEGSTIDLI